ncbi:hypothetical protein D3C75_558550 [compost metagenome]
MSQRILRNRLHIAEVAVIVVGSVHPGGYVAGAVEADSKTVALPHTRRHVNHLGAYLSQPKGPVLLQLSQQDVLHLEMQCRLYTSLPGGDGQKSALPDPG